MASLASAAAAAAAAATAAAAARPLLGDSQPPRGQRLGAERLLVDPAPLAPAGRWPLAAPVLRGWGVRVDEARDRIPQQLLQRWGANSPGLHRLPPG